jgi:hypothetical protein
LRDRASSSARISIAAEQSGFVEHLRAGTLAGGDGAFPLAGEASQQGRLLGSRRRFGRFDDLMDPLVAETHPAGDLPGRFPRGVQPPDGVVVVGAGTIGGVLRLDKALTGRDRLSKQTLVHAVYTSRQDAIVKTYRHLMERWTWRAGSAGVEAGGYRATRCGRPGGVRR